MKFTLIIAFIFSLNIFTQETYQFKKVDFPQGDAFFDIDLRFDYLRLTKQKNEKMLVAQCNQTVSRERIKLESGEKLYKRSEYFKCTPITKNANESCFAFTPLSKHEDESESLYKKAAGASILFPPFLFFSLPQYNHKLYLEKIRTILEKNKSQYLYIGVSKTNRQLITLNSLIDENSFKFENDTVDSYIHPYKTNWLNKEAKLIRKTRNILNKSHNIEGDEEFNLKADLSCTNFQTLKKVKIEKNKDNHK